MPSPIPFDLVRKLKVDDYIAFIAEERSPFHNLTQEERVPLLGLSKLMLTLLWHGAETRRFEGV